MIGVIAVILLTAVNIRSVKVAARLQNVTALAYLAAVIVTPCVASPLAMDRGPTLFPVQTWNITAFLWLERALP